MKFLQAILLSCLFASSAIAETPTRIVSIGGTVTEIIYALESQSALVGSDTTSYYPEAAKELPKVGYLRALSAEGILSLNPDMIIMMEDAGPPAVLQQLKQAGIPIVQIQSSLSVEDVKLSIRSIGNVLHQETKATELIAKIEQEYLELNKTLSKKSQHKKVMFLLQHGSGTPLIAGKNTSADSIIRLSGAKNIAMDFYGYKPMSPEAIVALIPDVIIVTDIGIRQAGGMDNLLKTPGISLTPAAQNKAVIAMDALQLLGFGPRVVETATQLHEAYQDQ